MIGRRSFLAGVFSAFAAPAIVRASSIMPVRSIYRGVPILTVDDLELDPLRLFTGVGIERMRIFADGSFQMTDIAPEDFFKSDREFYAGPQWCADD